MIRRFFRDALGMILAIGLGCCCPKRVCPPTPPARVVEIQKPCMDKLPDLHNVAWPAPSPDGTYHLSVENAKSILILLQYTVEQYTKCQML